MVLSFKTQLPFDRLPVWKELRALPLGEQKTRLRDPELRKKLVAAARERDDRKAIGTEARPAAYDWIFVMDTVDPPHKSVAEIARERGVDPVEAMIDLGARDGHGPLLLPADRQREPGARARADQAPARGGHLLRLGRARLAAHGLARSRPTCSSHWVRAKQALTLEQAVRMLSFVPAT